MDEFYVGQCGMGEATMDIKRRLKSKSGTLALFDECAWFSGLLISAGFFFLFSSF